MKPDPSAILKSMKERFGSLYSNGVAAILLHDRLPEVFDKSNWLRWHFKPAPLAFEWARDNGLMTSEGDSDTWRMTPLGLKTARLLQRKADRELPHSRVRLI